MSVLFLFLSYLLQLLYKLQKIIEEKNNISSFRSAKGTILAEESAGKQISNQVQNCWNSIVAFYSSFPSLCLGRMRIRGFACTRNGCYALVVDTPSWRWRELKIWKSSLYLHQKYNHPSVWREWLRFWGRGNMGRELNRYAAQTRAQEGQRAIRKQTLLLHTLTPWLLRTGRKSHRSRLLVVWWIVSRGGSRSGSKQCAIVDQSCIAAHTANVRRA